MEKCSYRGCNRSKGHDLVYETNPWEIAVLAAVLILFGIAVQLTPYIKGLLG